MSNFISLHNHTTASILDALNSPKDLFERAKELNQKAIAITDHGTFGAAYESLKISKEYNVKLIIGCELYFQENVLTDEKFRHIILLAKNAEGYKNLLTLTRKGYDNNSFNGKRVYSIINWDLLEKYSEGLICLTSCGNGIISQLLMNKKFDEAERDLLKLKNIFKDNLALEVSANNLKRGSLVYNDEIDQVFINRKLIEYGKKYDIKVVPTCNSHFTKKEDFEIHDAELCIGSHQTIYSNFRLKYNSDFYLKSEQEIILFFSRNYGEEFANTICQNTLYFADLCEEPNWIDPKYSNPSGKELPEFPVKDQPDYNEFKDWLITQNEYVKNLSIDRAYLRFRIGPVFQRKIIEDKIPEDKIQEYKDRIDKELDVFEELDLSSYMLITADFLDFARNNDIPVGPGRGSAGGSYVNYLLNIHCADSIKYDLVFERFHNKLKKAVSDIDNDIAPLGRDKVIDYVSKKYGEDNVAHVSNFNRITPKVYVRDIARVCELGGSKEEAVKIGNDIADCIPYDLHSMDDVVKKVPLFNEYAKRYPELTKYMKVAGKTRAAATHAAGIIIGKRPLVGLVPVRKDKDGNVSVEYDKDVAEENGLVKIDFLGLNTLDIITETFNLIKQAGKPIPKINVEEYDKKTYDLISSGNTYGVFQFGTSAGTIDLCKKIKPKSIEDLAIITTLARPASKEIREDFILTRNGKKQVALLHPKLENAFSKTFGFPLYDESLLILAKDIAGWDLGEADKLRKLTKEKGKNPQKAKKWRQEFIDGAVNNGLHPDEGAMIWEKVVEPFGKYSFNKSHAVLYSMVSYQTAYLKANYPIEFLLANLMSEVKSSTPDAKTNIEKIKNELRDHGVEIVPPNLNKSQMHYTIENKKQLITGLDALKFVGDDAIIDILDKRPFSSFLDFMVRVDSSKVRANTIQALASSGCLDEFGISRKLIYLYCSDYRKKLQVWLKKHDPTKEEFVYPFPNEKDWSISEKYALEQYYLGEAFICKSHMAYGNFFLDEHDTLADINKLKDKTKLSNIKVIVKSFFEFKVKKEASKYYGKSMVKATVEDKNGNTCSLTIFPDRFENVKEAIKIVSKKSEFDNGIGLNFSGSTNNYEDNIGIILDDIYMIAPIPTVPADLKAKKVVLKNTKLKENDSKPLIEQIEDNLYDQGLIDLDDFDI